MIEIDFPVDSHLIFLILKVIVITIASIISVKIFNRFVTKAVNERSKLRKGLLLQVNKLIQLIIYSIALILILWTFNIDVTALVAGLGVGALIIGFALKEIIENWVSGLIIISGKTYRLGDVITVGDVTGVVTDISLRTTSLKTYDRNEVIIPNSALLKDRIVNQTSGKKETVASIIFSIDYIYDVEKAKKLIEGVLRTQETIVVDEKKRREIRFVIRVHEWTTEIETLFWINEPEQEVFIKSKITELLKKRLEEENILPPLPGFMRREFMESKK